MPTKKKKNVKKSTKRKISIGALRKKRSAASRKGWETRRLREQTEPVLVVTEKVERPSEKSGKKVEKGKKKEGKLKSGLYLIDEMSEEEVRVYARKLEEKAKHAGWVIGVDLDMTRRDGTLAKEPSRLRHMGKATDKLLKMLKQADKRGGESELMRVSRIVSSELDVPLREVFTLFHSP